MTNIIVLMACLALWAPGAVAQTQTPDPFNIETLDLSILTTKNPFQPKTPVLSTQPTPEARAKEEEERQFRIRKEQMEKKRALAEETRNAATAPAETVVKGMLPKITVTGIVWNTNRPQAIINGQVVDVGDTVADAQITAIKPQEIEVDFFGQALTIKP